MDDETFEHCLKNEEIRQGFANVISQASKNWSIQSTPSIIINDGEKIITGAQPFAPMDHVIQQFLTYYEDQAAQ